MRKTKNTDILLFTKHLAVSLKSGITLVEGLEMVEEESKGGLKKVVRNILENVKSGSSFHAALSKYPEDFSAIYINLVKTGEISGTLEESLDLLALQQRKSYELTKKIQSAMMYPMLILIAISGLGFSVALFVLPKLLPLFEAFSTDLPVSTKILLWLSRVFTDHGIFILMCSICLILALILIPRLNAVKPYSHALILKLPLIKTIVKNINLERFTRTFGTLLKSAIPVDESLIIMADATRNMVYKKAILEFIQEVKKGNDLAAAMTKHENIFPKITSKIVAMGERTGNMDEMLLYLSDFYENEVDTTMKDLSTILEPALLIIIGSIVAGVAIAILGPIYKITGSIQ